MKYIFIADTDEGHSWKILTELLHQNLKTAEFMISAAGISLKTMNDKTTFGIDVNLSARNFSAYLYNSPQLVLPVGINIGHLHKMLKTVKKHDSIQFFITKDNPNELGIKIIPKLNNRTTTSFVIIQEIQHVDIVFDDDVYDHSIKVPSGEFQKMCKGLNISNETRVEAKNFFIRFISDSNNVMKRYTDFGKNTDEFFDSADESKQEQYSDIFDTEQFVRIAKLAGLDTSLQIYPCQNKSLLMRTNVGHLGDISIYLKSKSMLDSMSTVPYEDSDSDSESDDE